jgi:hypothetical protein
MFHFGHKPTDEQHRTSNRWAKFLFPHVDHQIKEAKAQQSAPSILLNFSQAYTHGMEYQLPGLAKESITITESVLDLVARKAGEILYDKFLQKKSELRTPAIAIAMADQSTQPIITPADDDRAPISGQDDEPRIGRIDTWSRFTVNEMSPRPKAQTERAESSDQFDYAKAHREQRSGYLSARDLAKQFLRVKMKTPRIIAFDEKTVDDPKDGINDHHLPLAYICR